MMTCGRRIQLGLGPLATDQLVVGAAIQIWGSMVSQTTNTLINSLALTMIAQSDDG